LSHPSFPTGAEHEIAFWTGAVAVAVGVGSLLWRPGLAGSALLLGPFPLFYTLLLHVNLGYEPGRGLGRSTALYLAIGGSALIVVAGLVGLVGAVDAFRRKQDTWVAPTKRTSNGFWIAALAHLGILLFVAIPLVVFLSVGPQDVFVGGRAELSTFQLSFESSDRSNIFLLAHLGMLIAAVAVPLLVFFTVGQRDAFVRRHATEAFNFHLSFLVLWAAGILAQVAIFYSGGHTPAFVLALMTIALTCAVAASVVAAIRAQCGRFWRYHLAIPVLKCVTDWYREVGVSHFTSHRRG
jgi:uncharacterized Tic20 family protein